MPRRMLAWAGLPLAALLVYCEARHGLEGPALNSAPPFRVAPVTSTSSPVTNATFSLSDFRPLLTEPSLATVAAALETGKVSDAAQKLSTWLENTPPPVAERFRYDFLLARLQEQSAQFSLALAGYARVSAGNSPLCNYARVGEARALLALGGAKEVDRRLGPVPDDEPVAKLKWPVAAEAARLRGDRVSALAAYDRALASMAKGSERADYELHLATILLEPPTPADTARPSEMLRALELARHIQNETSVSRATLLAARTLEASVLGVLPEPLRSTHIARSAAERLEQARALFDARHFEEARVAADETLSLLPEAERRGAAGCELQFLLGKSLSAARAYDRAGEVFEALFNQCSDSDLRSRALFMAGKAAASDGQYMLAIQRFAALEREFPSHSLADDARLYGALAYLELGVEARFTELLSSLPDDYPDGDMVVEGSFRLALRRLDKQDYQGAARVLERVLDNKLSTGARAADFAGRERYFHARAIARTGDGERALAEYETLIRDLPLSYYMLCAYSALAAADQARAEAALGAALAAVPSAKVVVTTRPEFSGPGFVRALELFGVGDLEDGSQELDALGLADSSRPEILWGLSKLYAEAGSVKLSHAAARRALSAAPPNWPADDWMDAWKLAFPAPYQEIVLREAKRSGQSRALIYAIMREESAFDPDAESPADAYGLMQLIEPTAKAAARPLGLPFDRASLKRPSVNVALGSSVLAQYAAAFPENVLLAIPAYNAGPNNPKRWLRERPTLDFDIWVELIPFVETRRYVKRVLSSRAAYAFLYQRENFESFATLPSKVQ